MNKFLKKFCSTENFCIVFLTVLVVSVGYLAFFQEDFNTDTSLKSNSNRKTVSSYSYKNYDSSYNQNNYNNQTQTTYKNNYQYSNYTNNYYTDTNPPSIRWNNSRIVNQYETFDPMKGVSANHSKFGDVTDIIQITYNDVDTSMPGNYTVVYKACNYPGSVYCRTASTSVTVRAKNIDIKDDSYIYSKGPVWSNNKKVSCSQGSTKCSTNNISKPTAKDPVTKRELYVTLVSGSVNIYQPGTYTLIYRAETASGVVGTTSKIITIQQTSSGSSNITVSYPQSKYINNYNSQYYDDGMYRGYLNKENNNLYINNHKWTNVVTYVYKCVNRGSYGTKGWEWVATPKSNGQYSDHADNHPTYYYSQNGYSGYLNKTNAYLADPEYKRENDLGYCNYVGTTKEITSTWIGEYSGYVYKNSNSYSGYVYLYK